MLKWLRCHFPIQSSTNIIKLHTVSELISEIGELESVPKSIYCPIAIVYYRSGHSADKLSINEIQFQKQRFIKPSKLQFIGCLTELMTGLFDPGQRVFEYAPKNTLHQLTSN